MSTVLTHRSQIKTLPKNWQKTAESYTSDEVIDAYLRGVKTGQTQDQKRKNDKFLSNFSQAREITESFYNYLIQIKIPVAEALIRINSIISFDIAIIVNKKDYLSEKFREVYNESLKIRKETYNSTFNIFFHFIPNSKSLDKELMAYDGFIFSYEPQSSKSTSRSRKA